MNDDTLFVEVEYCQRSKHGQAICGDAFVSQKVPAERRIVAVLSDGLGSGVKANILATMTATMAMKFVSQNMEIVNSAKVIMDALPICQVRKISYATFTIVDTTLNGKVRIIEMGNPSSVVIRDGQALELEAREMNSPGWKDRTLRFVDLEVQPEDRVVFFSDGISQAGLGSEGCKLGWRVRGCQDYCLNKIAQKPTVSARQLAQDVVYEALSYEEQYVAGDDMTCGVMYFRQPRRLLVMTGPPFVSDDDGEHARMFSEFPGRKAVCGGTTANIIARELNRPITTNLRTRGSDLPPTSAIKGVDLVTEGILTLTRAAQYIEQDVPAGVKDSASQLVDLLRESDIIDFHVGTRINEAHQDPNLPVDLEIRRNIVKRIAKGMEEKYLKEVRIQYI